MKFRLSLVTIHVSFWIAALVFWALGLGITFLIVAASVSVHELSHVLAAKVFGCEVGQLKISAMGEMALIHQMDKLSAGRRGAIYIAGPLCNFLLWTGAFFLPFDTGLFGFYNLVLCAFNLLPIFPLDGARLVQLWMGNRIGVMSANRFILRVGLVYCVILMLLGLVQAVLFAPNFTMLIAGFILWRRNRSIKTELTGEFYIAMLNKPACLMPTKQVCAYSDQKLSPIVDSLGWDNILIVTVLDKNNAVITEPQIVKYVSGGGLQDTILDLMQAQK